MGEQMLQIEYEVNTHLHDFLYYKKKEFYKFLNDAEEEEEEEFDYLNENAVLVVYKGYRNRVNSFSVIKSLQHVHWFDLNSLDCKFTVSGKILNSKILKSRYLMKVKTYKMIVKSEDNTLLLNANAKSFVRDEMFEINTGHTPINHNVEICVLRNLNNQKFLVISSLKVFNRDDTIEENFLSQMEIDISIHHGNEIRDCYSVIYYCEINYNECPCIIIIEPLLNNRFVLRVISKKMIDCNTFQEYCQVFKNVCLTNNNDDVKIEWNINNNNCKVNTLQKALNISTCRVLKLKSLEKINTTNVNLLNIDSPMYICSKSI